MASKVLIIISTGDKDKALTGLGYAYRAKKQGWMDDVKVIFFGPSEHLLLKDEDIAQSARKVASIGEEPIACKNFADRNGITEKIENLGIKVDYVGPIISSLIKEDYVPMVF
jgi:hypothetical protein